MSEYQYYEFLALDRPLTENQLRDVRRFSSRARITPTSFVNVYNWGDFRGDVTRFMTAYYDAFVYVANWGTHMLSFRLPQAEIGTRLFRRFCCTDCASLRLVSKCAILTLLSEDDNGGGWDNGEGWMSSLAPLRADLLAGDLRSLYLAWLSWLGREHHRLDGDKLEPPVPPGLADLSASLQALAEFLRIDSTLIEVAAEVSPSLAGESGSADELISWVKGLPPGEKDSLLLRLAQEPPSVAQRELLRRFRQARRPREEARTRTGRTVGQLVAAWQRGVEDRRRQAAEERAREEARRRRAESRARKRRLDELSCREAQAWKKVDALIRARQPKEYDEAVQLLRDLRDLAERDGRADEATARIERLRAKHYRKSSLLRRLDAVQI